MKKSFSGKQHMVTKVIAHTWKGTRLSAMDKNSLTIPLPKPPKNIQPTDDFLYSERCYCGIY